jgi:hypothetical protein
MEGTAIFLSLQFFKVLVPEECCDDGEWPRNAFTHIKVGRRRPPAKENAFKRPVAALPSNSTLRHLDELVFRCFG